MSTPLPTPWVLDAYRDPPVYTRPLVGSELVMQRRVNTNDGEGEACFGINFTSSLEVGELKDRACGALDKLRFICPIITCNIEDVVSPRWVYTPSADREAWLNFALAVEERGASLNPFQFVQRINLRKLPYIDGNGATTFFRAYLLTTSKEGDGESREYGLYFHVSHAIFDAWPAYHALNLMCEWISGEGMDVSLEPSEEWRNLAVDPITATGGPSGEWDTAGERLLEEFWEQSARTSPCHTLAPPSGQSNMSDAPFHHVITASESDTAAIVVKAKQLGVTVSTLFYAAHCMAQFKMKPIPEGETEVDFPFDLILVSLERYMKPPVEPRTHLVSSFTLMPSRFSMAEPLTERTEKERLIMTAKLLQGRFDRYLDDPCLPHLSAVLADMMPAGARWDDSTEHAGHWVKPKQVQMPLWYYSVQNLGIIEKKLRTKHGKITVGSICFGTRSTNWMFVHTWTMHSKLHFQIHGATAWGEEYMKTLLEEMLRIGLLVLDEP